MALFPRNIDHYTHADSHRKRRVAPPHEPHGFPDRLKRLDVLCQDTENHPLPVKMKFIAESMSDRGQPMAIYACPFKSCVLRQGWVIDRRKGRPFRLWAGRHTR